MLFLFVDLNANSAPLSVSERHGSEKQLSVAIVMTRKQSCYFLWPKSRHRMVACSYQAAFSNLVSHSTWVWLQFNHHKYISSHHRKTRLEHCIKLVSCRCTATLQKARRITE